MPFYVGDWLKAPDIQSLPYELKGLWFEMMCFMWESRERGVLLYSHEELSRLLRLPEVLLEQKLQQLYSKGIYSTREHDGAIFSRRMVRDQEIRELRTKAGSLGGRRTFDKHFAQAKVEAKCESENENDNENDNRIKDVFDYFCLKLAKKILLSPERRKIIEKRLQEGRTVIEMRQAIDHFALDTWEDRHKFCDLVYVVGVRNKVDNLDKWLNQVPPPPPTREKSITRRPIQYAMTDCKILRMDKERTKARLFEEGYTDKEVGELIESIKTWWTIG